MYLLLSIGSQHSGCLSFPPLVKGGLGGMGTHTSDFGNGFSTAPDGCYKARPRTDNEPSRSPVISSAEPTPPIPPFARGGKKTWLFSRWRNDDPTNRVVRRQQPSTRPGRGSSEPPFTHECDGIASNRRLSAASPFDPQGLHEALTRAISTHDVPARSPSAGRFTRPMPVSTRSFRSWSRFPPRPTTLRPPCGLCSVRRPDHGSGRGDLPGRPVDRPRGDSRLLQALRPRARNQSRSTAGLASSRDACSTT